MLIINCIYNAKTLCGGCFTGICHPPVYTAHSSYSPARSPAGTGPVEECPWCCHTFTPNPYSSISALEKHRKAKRATAGASAGSAREAPSSASLASVGGDEGVDGDVDKGRLAPVAAKNLMKILYGARSARLDLLRAVSHLACYFTKWTSMCDKRLHQLVCYINSTLHHRMLGWIGGDVKYTWWG